MRGGGGTTLLALSRFFIMVLAKLFIITVYLVAGFVSAFLLIHDALE